MVPQTNNKFLNLFKSRKFWACLLAILAAIGAWAYGEITVWQLLQAVVASAAAYSTGVAIEDSGIAR